MIDGPSPLARFFNTIYYMLDTPVTYFREKIVEPNQQKYPWYHQQYRRVPTIDQCYTDDIVCFVEADMQFKRDKSVDDAVLDILRSRYEACLVYHGDDKHLCDDLYEIYQEASGAWFCKYGDLGVKGNVKHAYMKQKHRLVWERRHGPVGSGMKTE